jgi:hypothetical protein
MRSSRPPAGCARRPGPSRVAAIGIGLGGFLAVRAVARGASVDDLVLWAVRSRGAALLREMRAYARVIADRYPEDSRPDLLTEGELDPAGFGMSGETTRALRGVELTSLALPRDRPRRVLVLERDGLPVDRALREHFERAGTDVTVRPTGDYTPMMLEPQDSLTPRETIATTIAWLEQGSRPVETPATPGRARPGMSGRPAWSARRWSLRATAAWYGRLRCAWTPSMARRSRW